MQRARASAAIVLTGVCLNIKMPSYHYGDSHYKNKTVSWLSFLYNENPDPESFYIETGPWGPSQYKDIILPV